MNMLSKIRISLAGLALCAGSSVVAQSGPISILVGFPPGGSTDMMARVIGDQMAKHLGRQVIVENRPGAGGRVAALALKNSAPDGRTYLVMPNASAVLNQILYTPEILGYDLIKDMEPVSVFATGPLGLAVSSTLGVNTVDEYVNWVKKSGTPGLYGTAGQGGQTHFVGLAFGKSAGIPMTVVPYRGNGPMVTDLVAGQVPAGISVVGDLLPHMASGKIKLLGIFGNERSPLVPDVPTMKEAGVDVVAGDAWTGMWARAGSPKADTQQVREAVKKALTTPEVQEALRRASLLPVDLAGKAMGDKVNSEIAFWEPIIRESGFKPEQ